VNKSICRIGVFYDGSFFIYAQRYFYRKRKLGWLSHRPFHTLIEDHLREKEQGFASYKIVYAGWYQGMFPSSTGTLEQLRFDRNYYHDLMHAGIEPKYLPMSQSQGEKGIDVAMAVDTLQVGLDGKIDIAALVTGDGDFVPLVRALMKHGIRVLSVYFEYDDGDGDRAFINDRLAAACNYTLNVNALEKERSYGAAFKSLFRKPD